MRPFSIAAAVVRCAAGCHKKKQVSVVTPAGTQPAPAATQATSTAKPGLATASPQLGVSEDIVKQCRLQLDPQKAPKFQYDEFSLLPEDRAVLERVAICITSGPLKGRKLELVGRADPRGTQEYNLGLGDRRASTVSTYLQRLGVSNGQLATV